MTDSGAFRFLVFIILFSSCTTAAPGSGRALFKSADTAFEVQPLRVHAVSEGGSADAMEVDPERAAVAEAIVNFKILRVLKGDWPMVPVGGPSRAKQAYDAVHNKKYVKMLTLDFDDPHELVRKEWFSVAVEDPGSTFGISSWDAPEPEKLKIYLKRDAAHKGSFLLIGALPLHGGKDRDARTAVGGVSSLPS
ncbi:MAG: hypothetical protein A2Y02_00390 [Omnitrophica bacterium GWA2_52_12]|nr:MAG: hypothetical protein A2Y02_00390 [Omnitrophica bacterium GWA2_52_12]